GTGVAPAGSPYAGSTVQTVTGWSSQVTLQGISDGTSNTLLIGEKHIRPTSLRGKNEDRSVFDGNRNCWRRLAGWTGGGAGYPVTGKVVFEQGDVKLLAGSAVYAQHDSEPYQATGDIREDGTFELQTRTPEGRKVPGAPEGKYWASIRFNTDAGTEESQLRKS